jgi:hypothetical protein
MPLEKEDKVVIVDLLVKYGPIAILEYILRVACREKIYNAKQSGAWYRLLSLFSST